MGSRITLVTLLLALATPALAEKAVARAPKVYKGKGEQRIWVRDKALGWKSTLPNGTRRSVSRRFGGPLAGQGLESNVWKEGTGRWQVTRKFAPGGKIAETTVSYQDPKKGIGIDASVRGNIVKLSTEHSTSPEHERVSKQANQYLRTKGSILKLGN